MESLSAPRPTIEWKKQLQEGTDFYTEQAIIDSDKLLDKYIDALKKSENEIEIWEAIEKVVKGFDELNIKHNYFIENTEREDLAAFIQNSAETAGLNYDGDVTEEWRTEW